MPRPATARSSLAAATSMPSRFGGAHRRRAPADARCPPGATRWPPAATCASPLGGSAATRSRLAFGQGAGLVEGDHVDGVRDFERLGVLDQDAVARGDAGAGHDRGRRRQPERARAGDDQHRDRVEDRRLPVAAWRSPQPSSVASAMPITTGTNTALTRSTSRWIGAFFACADSTSRTMRASVGLGADRAGAHDQQAFAIDRAAGHAVALLLGHRQALAGDQRLVDLARAFEHDAIDRHALARPHDHQVIDTHLRERHFDLGAVAAHARACRAAARSARGSPRWSGAWRASRATCRAAPA